jgi:hypothetical protein
LGFGDAISRGNSSKVQCRPAGSRNRNTSGLGRGLPSLQHETPTRYPLEQLRPTCEIGPRRLYQESLSKRTGQAPACPILLRLVATSTGASSLFAFRRPRSGDRSRSRLAVIRRPTRPCDILPVGLHSAAFPLSHQAHCKSPA